jgi:hypothetical protein
MSHCQHPSIAVCQGWGSKVPLHVIPYRVESCISGRHLVGALASRRDYGEDGKDLQSSRQDGTRATVVA